MRAVSVDVPRLAKQGLCPDAMSPGRKGICTSDPVAKKRWYLLAWGRIDLGSSV